MRSLGNPARKVILPRARAGQGDEIAITGKRRSVNLRPSSESWGLDFSTLAYLTGMRIGEVLALTKADILPGGLKVDESALEGHASSTKNGKTRQVPLEANLRADIDRWAASGSRRALVSEIPLVGWIGDPSDAVRHLILWHPQAGRNSRPHAADVSDNIFDAV